MSLINIHTHRQGDSTRILDISDGHPLAGATFFSAGVHPRYVERSLPPNALEELAAKGKLAAIGEAGFDRRSTTDMDTQTQLFEAQIRLSESYRLPLIIHCVKAYPELLTLHVRLHPRMPWIVHGYNNNGQILDDLLKSDGIFISAGPRVLDENSNIRHLLPFIPLDRLFLETDDTDFTIEDVYQGAAQTLAIPVDSLETKINQN